LYGRENREEERRENADETAERDGDEDGEGQRERRTVWHKTQVRILFSGGRGRMVPRWVKYSGPVPSKGAGLSPPWTP